MRNEEEEPEKKESEERQSRWHERIEWEKKRPIRKVDEGEKKKIVM